jgi:hypothetical protein
LLLRKMCIWEELSDLLYREVSFTGQLKRNFASILGVSRSQGTDALLKDFCQMYKKDRHESLSFFSFMEELFRHDWFLQFALEDYPQKFIIWLYQLKEGLGDEFFFKDSLDNVSGNLSLKAKLCALMEWYKTFVVSNIGQHCEELTRVLLESWDQTETRFSFVLLLKSISVFLNPLKESVGMVTTKNSKSLEGVFKTISSLGKEEVERSLDLKKRVLTPDKEATKSSRGLLRKVSNGAGKAVKTVSNGAGKVVGSVTSLVAKLPGISFSRKRT